MKLGCWFLIALILGHVAFAQAVSSFREQFVSGVIETLDGERLAKAKVQLTNIGTAATSDDGEFSLALPASLQVGDPIRISLCAKRAAEISSSIATTARLMPNNLCQTRRFLPDG